MLCKTVPCGFFWYTAPAPVQNIQVTFINSSALTVAWDPPSTFNGEEKPYYVELVDASAMLVLSGISVLKTSATFNRLTPYYNYTVHVLARSSGGNSTIRKITKQTSATGKLWVQYGNQL